MCLLCLLLLSLLACSKPVVPPPTYTYDDGKGSLVQLKDRQVKVISTHFDPVEYALASDNVALKLTEFNSLIDSKGSATATPPSVGNGVKLVAAGLVPEATMMLEQLVPKKDGVGPDGGWIGGRLGHSDLEGGFWTVTATGNKYVVSGGPPEGFKAGQTVVLTGTVNTDEMSAANAGPLYRPTAWRHWKD